MFRMVFHPSSGSLNTVSTVSGIIETVTATCRESGWIETGLGVGWIGTGLGVGWIETGLGVGWIGTGLGVHLI